MNDRDEAGAEVLADAHVQEGDVPGDQLGGGLGNSSEEGASDA
jgi:hypothetical protein